MEGAVPKQSPVPNELDKAFYAAANDDRLLIQHCEACGRYQYPPDEACAGCGAAGAVSWREVEGRGTIYSYAVVYDSPILSLQADLPYNVAVIDLDECPGVNMYSHLPGTPVDEVPIGAQVEVTFEPTPATGQKVPEWRVVDAASGVAD
jgi:uncharacterized OB-fold protein